MIDLEHDQRRSPYEPPRTIAPRRLPSPLPADLNANATVVRPFTLHNCGLVGSPDFRREIPAGTRVRATSSSCDGLLRVHLGLDGGRGALVDVENLERDEDVRHGS